MPSFSPPLVRAAVSGDQAALIGLIEAARPDIRRYARAACHMSDVDDAVQETLLLVYRRIGTLQAISAFPAWLFSIVRRECIRLARAFAHAPAQEAAETIVLAQPDPVLRLDIVRAIQSLPEHYRSIIVMRDLEERTIDEMAGALDLTREAVKGRLHRARALMREHLLR